MVLSLCFGFTVTSTVACTYLSLITKLGIVNAWNLSLFKFRVDTVGVEHVPQAQ